MNRRQIMAMGLVVVASLSPAACSDVTEPQGSFRLELEPADLTLIRGETDTVRVTVVGENGFDEPVTLEAAPETEEVSLDFDANPTASTSGLTLAVATGATPASRTVTVTGRGGGEQASAELSLTIAGELPGDPSELHAPGVVGEVRTVEIDGEEFTYEVIDGLAIFQGDIILGDAEGVEEELRNHASGGASGIGPQAATCAFDFLFGCARWTDGIIGYAFANNWGADSTNLMMRQRIRRAMRHWEDRTRIRFVSRTDGERVVFRDADGCSSDIGRREITGLDPQYINLDTDCGFGTVVHEIGHAVGFWHEQARLDRDAFVRVDFGAVEDGRLHNFFTHAGLGLDVGAYNYGSIMHYSCRHFARDARNTIEPLPSSMSCADIGQRDSLSEGDILGAYTLYPPAYTITGASPSEVGDRFDLGVSFDTEPVRDDYIVWTSDRVSGALGTGPTLSVRDADVPSGDHVITAGTVIFGTTVVRESIDLTFSNSAPNVDLGADRDVDLNRLFYLTPTVTDTEDADCPPTACDYTWSPAPESSSGATAGYRFDTEGPQTIEVVVTDDGGATGTDAITANVVNSPPAATIDVPSDGSSFNEGFTLTASGSATDLNEGADPGPGELDCSRLDWYSSDSTDAFGWTGDACSPTLTFGDAGTRTIELVATDPQGLADTAGVSVTVNACSGNCPPDAWFDFDTPPDFDDSSYSMSFDDPGYYLATAIEMTATVSDADSPPDNPIGYRWTAQRVCEGTGCPTAIVIGQGELMVPGASDPVTTALTWTPGDDVSSWSGCVTEPRAYTITFEVIDDRGASNSFARQVMLACALI